MPVWYYQDEAGQLFPYLSTPWGLMVTPSTCYPGPHLCLHLHHKCISSSDPVPVFMKKGSRRESISWNSQETNVCVCECSHACWLQVKIKYKLSWDLFWVCIMDDFLYWLGWLRIDCNDRMAEDSSVNSFNRLIMENVAQPKAQSFSIHYQKTSQTCFLTDICSSYLSNPQNKILMVSHGQGEGSSLCNRERLWLSWLSAVSCPLCL